MCDVAHVCRPAQALQIVSLMAFKITTEVALRYHDRRETNEYVQCSLIRLWEIQWGQF